MKTNFDVFDFAFASIILSACICAIIFCSLKCRNMVEEDCVKFYKDNHYILKSCEVYKDKLLRMGE